jgi:hypothetical protein
MILPDLKTCHKVKNSFPDIKTVPIPKNYLNIPKNYLNIPKNYLNTAAKSKNNL